MDAASSEFEELDSEAEAMSDTDGAGAGAGAGDGDGDGLVGDGDGDGDSHESIADPVAGSDGGGTDDDVDGADDSDGEDYNQYQYRQRSAQRISSYIKNRPVNHPPPHPPPIHFVFVVHVESEGLLMMLLRLPRSPTPRWQPAIQCMLTRVIHADVITFLRPKTSAIVHEGVTVKSEDRVRVVRRGCTHSRSWPKTTNQPSPPLTTIALLSFLQFELVFFLK